MKPKILVFDIETYGGLKANFSEVSMFGYKWMGSKKRAHVIAGYELSDPFKSDRIDDRPILKALSKVWNEADVVVAHYGEKFDRRFLNTRMALHGLPPLKPMHLIDTWRDAKDHFALTSNRLDVLLEFFGSPYQKVNLSNKEWRAVGLGSRQALRKLKSHCRNDVDGLEWVVANPLNAYLRKLPNWNLFVDSSHPVCPYCGGTRLQRRGYRYSQKTTRMRSYQCLNVKCRRWSAGPDEDKGVLR